MSDALIKLKSPHGGLIPDVDMFSPKRLDGDTKVVGEAFTVKVSVLRCAIISIPLGGGRILISMAHVLKMVGKEDKDAPKPEQHFVSLRYRLTP